MSSKKDLRAVAKVGKVSLKRLREIGTDDEIVQRKHVKKITDAHSEAPFLSQSSSKVASKFPRLK